MLRGDPAACIAAVCQTSDIIIVAEPGPPIARTAYGVTRLHTAAYASAASVLLLPARHKPRRGHVVAVLADATDGSLEVACRIATAANEDVAILVSNDGAAKRVRERARILCLSPERITLRPIPTTRADDVLVALAGLHERLIVMTRPTAATDDASGASRISAARGVPVLLIEAANEGSAASSANS